MIAILGEKKSCIASVQSFNTVIIQNVMYNTLQLVGGTDTSRLPQLHLQEIMLLTLTGWEQLQ